MFRCSIINLEVRVLIFEKAKIVEANIGQEIFRVKSINGNDITTACTILSFDIIYQEFWRS